MPEHCDCGPCCETCGHTDDCIVWTIRPEDSYPDSYDHDAYTL